VLALSCLVGAGPASAGLPPVGHVFVIVLENKGVLSGFGAGQAAAPYMTRTLPSMGGLIPRYYGIGHSSADNYLAMISGQPPTPASKADCPDPLKAVGSESVPPYNLAKSDGCLYPANFRTLADQFTDRGLSWKGYMEDIPSNCSPLKNNPAAGTHYARKHNPFVFFRSLIDSGQCASSDVPLGELPADLATEDRTPNLVYITPNECNDAHTNCTTNIGDPASDTYFELQQGDAFLKEWVPKILASPAYKHDGLLFITFDEADLDASACCNEQPGPADPYPGSVAGLPFGPGGGVTGTIALSPFIKPGTVTLQEYNHYSWLRSMEDLLGSAHLGYAAPDGLVPFGDDLYTGPRPPGAPFGSAKAGS
jgi:phosphatidylinositol-3-phosphatase